ncbi:phosphopyruvate hydratase [Streptomyces sp. NPDC021020]|uniref:phosphopyruvate hydratase n=1 Tax=Streptomyces sp. NPDC021020 TaxID=3365109 RepID=UPI0037AE1204
MTLRFSGLRAAEILDSQGRPTLAVTLTLADGRRVGAGVPSGGSAGGRGATERRDADPARFHGQGVRDAVAYVNGEIADAVLGRDFASAVEVDAALIIMDGTGTKSRYGVHAVAGVSLAAARAEAAAKGMHLWESLAGVARTAPRLPVPHITVVDAGADAATDLAFREFMVAPLGAPSLSDAVRAGAEIYGRLRASLAAAGCSTALGDGGGFAPAGRPQDVLTLLVEAITDAGYAPGRDGVAISVNAAAGILRDQDRYLVAGKSLGADQLVDRYEDLVDRFPIWSIENALAEDDVDGWTRLTARLADRVQLVRDVLTTDPSTATAAVDRRTGNCALIAVDQTGTVTETLEAMRICRGAGYAQMVSHRPGETVDPFIADLAVGTGAGQIKSGAPAGGERVAKYNRLLALADACPALPYGLP